MTCTAVPSQALGKTNGTPPGDRDRQSTAKNTTGIRTGHYQNITKTRTTKTRTTKTRTPPKPGHYQNTTGTPPGQKHNRNTIGAPPKHHYWNTPGAAKTQFKTSGTPSRTQPGHQKHHQPGRPWHTPGRGSYPYCGAGTRMFEPDPA